ncbi:MAG: DUF6295 family protein [Nitriliruptorales bacterium]
MCTSIADRTSVEGSAKGPQGWFTLAQVHLGYDHPVHAALEHAVSLDFVNEELGLGTRVAVELTRESARLLAERLLATLELADACERGDG